MKIDLNHPIWLFLYRNIVTLLTYMIYSTYYFHIYDPGFVLKKKNRKPVIFAVWHGEIFPLMFLGRHRKKLGMVSESQDGELIAIILRQMGYQVVRGSSTRGGARGLLQLIHRLQHQKNDVIITPDGPKGPAHHIKPGLIYLALKSRFPIIVVRADTSRAFRLKSWDRFLIPCPGAHIHVSFSTGIHLNPQLTLQEQINDLEKKLQNL